MSKLWSVQVPFSGHMLVDVHADSEEEARARAFEEVTRENIESWEAVATLEDDDE